MENFFENPGLSHIGEKILKNLPFEDKVTCRLVQKSWKNILDKVASKVKLNDLLQMIQKLCAFQMNSDPPQKLFRVSRLKPWSEFLNQIHSKIENPWIPIYIENIFMRIKDNNEKFVSPLYTFAIVFGNVKMVNFILVNGLVENFSFNTLLSRVLRIESICMMECLKPFLTEKEQEFVIIQATQRYGHIKFVEVILLPDTKLSSDFLSSNFLLHMAAQKGSVKIVEFLLSKTQMFASYEDEFGNTPLFYAVENNHIEIVKLIVRHLNEDQLSEDFHSYCLAAKLGYYEILKILCQKVANPNVSWRNGDTFLHWAAGKGQFEIVKLLCSYTSNVNVTNEHGITPAMIARRNDYDEIANYLEHMTKGAKFSE